MVQATVMNKYITLSKITAAIFVVYLTISPPDLTSIVREPEDKAFADASLFTGYLTVRKERKKQNQPKQYGITLW